MYGTNSKNIQVRGQINHRCAYVGLGNNLLFAIRKLTRSFTCMCTVVFDTRGDWALFAKLCVWPESCCSAVCKMSCPTHRYANVQLSVVTTPFDLSCVYHCNLLLNFLTSVNFRYIVLPRINGFLCKKWNCTTFILWSLIYFEE